MGWGTIFLAILLNNIFYPSVVFLYVISFSSVNLINLVWVMFFLVFFCTMQLRVSKQFLDKKTGKVKEKKVSFAHKYWIVLVMFNSIILITRYVYYLQFFDIYKSNPLMTLIGFNCSYKFFLHWGFAQFDFATESIIWTLYIFVFYQYKSYGVKIYLKYAHKTQILIARQPFMQKHFPRYALFVHYVQTYTYLAIVWVTFLVITTNLILNSFNFINLGLLVIILGILIHHITRPSGKQAEPRALNYRTLIRIWVFYLLLEVAISLTRYLLQFTKLEWVKTHILPKDSRSWDTFQRNRAVYGFLPEISDDAELITIFISNMIDIIFGVFTLSFFVLAHTGQKLQTTQL